ncbi:MAG: hypothetical protein PHW69_04210 [Elusimicrobiaceae bacterium]|nr:hypothetical protein [Elusimicrobiaceae bacterium]
MNKKNKNIVYALVIAGSIIYWYLWWKKTFGGRPAEPPVAEAPAQPAEQQAQQQPAAVTPPAVASGTETAEAEVKESSSTEQPADDIKLQPLTKPEADESDLGELLFLPKSDKNPFISVAEIERVAAERRQKEDEIKRKREEERMRNAPKPRPRSRPEDLKAKIIVQGIVGNQVVVNGSVVTVGNNAKVDGDFVLVTATKGNRVWFTYKGTTFFKDLK